MVPTNSLRFVGRDSEISQRYIDPKGNIIKTVQTVRVLQQLWTDNNGQFEWRDVPLETE